MKVALFLVLLAAPVFGQDQSAMITAACGPMRVAFDVKQDNSHHALPQPEAGKSLIFIIQQRGLLCGMGAGCITKIGMDGAWVGAFKANSYFSVSVNPGDHHVCASLEAGGGLGQLKGFAHVMTEPGKTYYLRMYADRADNFPAILDVGAMDSDEAKYLIAISPLSVSLLKK